MSKGIGGHQKHGNGMNVWLTPQWIIDALGSFDLDPCAPPEGERPVETAIHYLTEKENGLKQEWFGVVWLNPPYDHHTGAWLERLSEHVDGGIALVFARTETRDFHKYIWRRAHAIFFFEGRIRFLYPDGKEAIHNSGGPSCLVAYGKEMALRLERRVRYEDFGFKGKFIRLKGKEDLT